MSERRSGTRSSPRSAWLPTLRSRRSSRAASRSSQCSCFPTERTPIALGTDAGTAEITNYLGETETYPVPPDRETLKTIADETGGRFFEAPTEADLEAVYEQIGSQVSYEDEERELTAAFAGAGAVLLLLGGSLSALWFGRIP